jgi:MerR family transcriptional regulator, redox-sensitive transcriptional activator SoxR
LKKNQYDILSIGEVAKRTGLSIPTIRFYEAEGLISVSRSSSGARQFRRSELRRLSFILAAKNLGFSLLEIKGTLNTLPKSRTPTKRDWELISSSFSEKINQRIRLLERLNSKLDSCMGCGCLSLENCHLYNENDYVEAEGDGPQFVL